MWRYLINLYYNYMSRMENYPIDKALTVIKHYEGLHELLPDGKSVRSYRDAVNIPTIGYGNTFYEDGTKVKDGDTIDKERAEGLLRHVVQDFKEKLVATLVDANTKVNVNEFNALLSFVYNVGIGAFRRSTLLKKLKAGNKKEETWSELKKWVKAGGSTMKGLVIRRETEYILALTGGVVLDRDQLL